MSVSISFYWAYVLEYYGQIHSTLSSYDPLPSLNWAFQKISREERARGITPVKDERTKVVDLQGMQMVVARDGRIRWINLV